LKGKVLRFSCSYLIKNSWENLLFAFFLFSGWRFGANSAGGFYGKIGIVFYMQMNIFGFFVVLRVNPSAKIGDFLYQKPQQNFSPKFEVKLLESTRVEIYESCVPSQS
jgi:hypothetical protein